MNYIKKLLKLTSLLFILLLNSLSAQTSKENYLNWFVGNGGSIVFNGSNFNPSTSSGNNTLSLDYFATYSNGEGNLIAYTNGEGVWDLNHSIMPNGNFLNGNISGGQVGIFVPVPQEEDRYVYLFTVDYYGGLGGLSYNKIDLTLNGGAGDIISGQKNVNLISNCSEKLIAIYDEHLDRTWLISHSLGNNNFYAYSIDQNGLNTTPVISSVGTVYTGGSVGQPHCSIGQMCYSPATNKLCCVLNVTNQIELFDFNLVTGTVSNPLLFNTGGSIAWGAAFSPNGNLLYQTDWTDSDIFQFNLTSGVPATIASSKQSVGTVPNLNPPYSAGYLSLGFDDKIYVAQWANDYIGAIEFPNLPGNACSYNSTAISLVPGFCNAGLCNFPFFDSSSPVNVRSNKEDVSKNAAVVYPNPAKDLITIKNLPVQNGGYTYAIYSPDMKLLQSGYNNDLKTEIDVTSLKQGVYFIHVMDEQNNEHNLCFVR